MIDMKKICILTGAALAIPLMANESFGGIGVSIRQVDAGAKIVDVIPGTPAAESGIRSNDVIIAVDGVQLKGHNIEYSKSMLRGKNNQPLQITYVSNGDTLNTVLRRTQITLKNLSKKSVEQWYGNNDELNVHEVEAYASAKVDDKQFVAVLQKGSVVNSETQIKEQNLDGVYIEKVNEFKPRISSQVQANSASAELKGVNRKTIEFSLSAAGAAFVSIVNADGKKVAGIRVPNANAGLNVLSWNGESIPKGEYLVVIECNGAFSGKNVLLK